MPKIDIDDVFHVVNELQLEPEKRKLFVQRVEELAQEAQLDKATKAPRSKKEMIVVVRSHKEDLCSDDFSLALFQAERDSDPEKMLEDIRKAAIENNINAKKPKNRVNNFNEVVSHLKPKQLKGFKIGKPAKEWLRFVFLDDSRFDSLSSSQYDEEGGQAGWVNQGLVNEDAAPIAEFTPQEE